MITKKAIVNVLLALALVCWACGCASSLSASSAEEQAVLANIQDFFDAMQHRDVELAGRTVIPEGVFVSVRQEEDGRSVRHFSNAQWMADLPNRTFEVREWLDGPTVMVEGDVAMVWSPYFFEREGEMSHTGIDVFCFVRTDDGWKMAGGAYSVVPVDK